MPSSTGSVLVPWRDQRRNEPARLATAVGPSHAAVAMSSSRENMTDASSRSMTAQRVRGPLGSGNRPALARGSTRLTARSTVRPSKAAVPKLSRKRRGAPPPSSGTARRKRASLALTVSPTRAGPQATRPPSATRGPGLGSSARSSSIMVGDGVEVVSHRVRSKSVADKSSGPVPAMRSSKRPSTVALTRIPEMPSSLSKRGPGRSSSNLPDRAEFRRGRPEHVR